MPGDPVRYTGIDVVVPVHDEQEHLGACLDALELCVAATPLPVTLTVVLDACADASEEIGLGRARIVRIAERNVGAARAAGFADVAARADDTRVGDPTPHGTASRWFATTDADSRVPPTWLLDQLRLAMGGADVVAGLVEVDDWSGWDPTLRAEYLSRYCSTAGHRHIHGANLGLSARAYRALGGFDPVISDEDVRLVRSAQEAGLTVAWSATSPVVTSARRIGRAPGGFSHHLAGLERERSA